MKLLCLTLCAIAGVAGWNGIAAATVMIPLGSDRFVSVLNRENSPPTTVSATGPAMGPWNATAYKANLTASDPNANPFGSAFAVTSSQVSDFDSAAITFAGFVFLDYSAIVFPNNGGTATNRCYISFRLDEACDYQFAANYSQANNVESAASVTLVRGAANVFSQSVSGSRVGTLLPGDYQLQIQMDGVAGGTGRDFDSRLDLNVTLTVPAPVGGAGLLPLALFVVRRRRR